MKLFLGRLQAAQRAAVARAGARRWNSTNPTTGSNTTSSGAAKEAAQAETAGASQNSVSSVRTTTPGTVRIRRGTNANATEMEMDTTITRMMGSDWGDRSKQPVSYAMKIYWGIFVIVLANGAFTYFAGKDERYLVEKIQKKVDERLGRVETNEFVIMADQQKPEVTETQEAPAADAASVKNDEKPAPAPVENFDLDSAPSSSMFASKPPPTPLPFFGAQNAARPTSKADYQRQLTQLRERQARAREERKDPSSFRSIDEIDIEIKRIDQQKAQIKQLIKKL